MDELFTQLEHRTGKPAAGRLNAGRFADAYRAYSGSDYDWQRPAGRLLLGIFGNSPALAQRLITHPGWADIHASDPHVDARKPREVFDRELATMLVTAGDMPLAGVGATLREFKYREMIRIAARDIAGNSTTEEILLEWSDCADALIDAAYHHVRGQLDHAHGSSCPGCIVGLGKLGGRELNYSSDVDLIVLYEHDAAEGNERGSLSPHEYHVRLATSVTNLLDAITPQGFVFRVDHDLRPEGPQGTLANSIDAAERYYENFGHDWERQALIRARPVAGDTQLGAAFIERVRPFVFRRSLAMSDLTSMKRLKERATDECASADEIDLKHGKGGIRSVEFMVQALELLYAGSIPRLREANTFCAIRSLANEGFIHPASKKRLLESYAFLRRCENMLQIADDQQVHVVPTDPVDVHALAQLMGFTGRSPDESRAHMMAVLNEYRAQTQRLFDALFEEDYERVELVEAIEANMSTCANEEEEHESIPWFKHQEVRRIQHLDLEGRLPLNDILARLSLVADVVVSHACSLALRGLTARYGRPHGTHGEPATFAVIGMGRFGSRELDYGSDLDLCFIYSADGATDGARAIANSEFFTRLAQRIISIISTRSRFGRAYEVDPELRPSGNAGTLVSSERAFIEYHLSSAPPWERLALLRSRVIDGQEPLLSRLRLMLREIAFESPPPSEQVLHEEMRRLRQRIHEELLDEHEGCFDIKRGPGGCDDVEAIIQRCQLLHASQVPALRRQNTFEILHLLAQHRLIEPGTHEKLAHALGFYRLVLSRIRLVQGRRFDLFDASSPHASTIANLAGYDSVGTLIEELKRHRETVRHIYETTIR